MLFFVLLLASILGSCRYGLDEFLFRKDDVNHRSTVLEDVAPPFDSSLPGQLYNILLLSDLHFGKGKTNAQAKLFAYLDELDPEELPLFCIALGDIADTGTASGFEEYKSLVYTLKTEYGLKEAYGIVGNHDLYNSGWPDWEKTVHPNKSFYSFSAAGFSWYFLDSGNGTLGSKQLRVFVDALKNDQKPKFVFIHYPLYWGGIFYFSLSDPRERAILIDACTMHNVKAVFSGHYHYGKRFNYGSFEEIGVYSFVNNRNMLDGTWGILKLEADTGQYIYQQF